ncbi:DctP4 [Desulforapulum autotrophicum HRM2]|uniref:DctP4 n=1 Tax=Desulforapulum autotrophicum (strain ATCC 43914 / DSM 3382 / VKM B-1955 / HRM2) TaxID=177437 RepID=C0QDI4_DESAH|nr:TRAP transporter substrate-binding protein [Desulforapulum autotrophicum]ACN15248.1 DctP4 [Desulforapulum autotrophicum HRM2]
MKRALKPVIGSALGTVAIAFLAVIAVVFVSIPPVSAKTISLNYANFPPAPTFPCVQMEQWKTVVETRTDNAVRINTFPGGTLLGPKEMMDGVISGQADIGCLCMAYQPGRFTVTNAVSLPLGIPDSKVGSLVLTDLFNAYKPKAFDKVKVLALFTTAPANIMSRKRVATLGDLKGMDLRASGGAAEILKIWGANQIGMPMSATPEALQKGVVQGLFSSLEVMKDLKFAEECPYATLTNTVVYPFAVVMNLDRWNALPQAVKTVMENLSREQAVWTGTYMDNHVNDAVEWSKKTHGVEFVELDDASAATWNKALAPITQRWITTASEKGFDGKAIVDTIQHLVDQHTKGE